MPDATEQNSPEALQSACWAIRYNIPSIETAIEGQVEKIFQQYNFYPEVEWPKYGCVPPESLPVLGAWRHPSRNMFAFLLDIPAARRTTKRSQVRLYVYGPATELRRCENAIWSLKASIDRVDRKRNKDISNREKLAGIENGHSLKHIIATTGVFTAIVNALSLYLRTVVPPEFSNSVLRWTYDGIVSFIHFAALSLLAAIAFIASAYVVRYGVLLIRRF